MAVLRTHGSVTDAWQCYDREHILFHHVESPTFVVVDQEDPTLLISRVYFADELEYDHPEILDYRARVLDQTRDLAKNWAADSRKEGAGAPGGLVVMLRKQRRDGQARNQANHVHLSSNEKTACKMTRCAAARVSIGSCAIATAVAAWITEALPTDDVVETASSWDGSTPYWITGKDSETPEQV